MESGQMGFADRVPAGFAAPHGLRHKHRARNRVRHGQPVELKSFNHDPEFLHVGHVGSIGLPWCPAGLSGRGLILEACFYQDFLHFF